MHRAPSLAFPALTTLLLATGLLLGACGAQSEAEEPASARLALPVQITPEPDRIVTGTLNSQKLQAIAAADVPHIVSLQPHDEHPDFDEAEQAQALGIRRHHLPIAGAADLDREAAQWLDGVLGDIGEEAAVLHCASGNRVGALIALRAAWIEGMPAEAAIDKGKRWGLTGLEGAVRERLSGGN